MKVEDDNIGTLRRYRNWWAWDVNKSKCTKGIKERHEVWYSAGNTALRTKMTGPRTVKRGKRVQR